MMGTRHIRIASLLLLLLGASWAAQAEVYKWFDADGRVQYGNNPPKGVNAKPISGGVTVVPAMKFKKSSSRNEEEHSSAAQDKEERNMSSGRPVPANKREAVSDSSKAGQHSSNSAGDKSSTLILPNGQVYKSMPGWSSPPIRPSSSKTANSSHSSNDSTVKAGRVSQSSPQ